MAQPTVSNEKERLKELQSYYVMDSLAEAEYDSITQLASAICGTSISLISLLDEKRQWFKSTVGLDATETPKNISFCQYAIQGDEVYEVENTLENPLFVNNPLVTGSPEIRFYAGAPLKNKDGFYLGTLCVIDTVPKLLTDFQKNALKLLANQVITLLELRRSNLELIDTEKELLSFVNLSKDLVCFANVNGQFYKVNPSFTTVLGYEREELIGKPFIDFVHPDDIEATYQEVAKLAKGELTDSFVNRYRCKNGSYVTLDWHVSPNPETGNLYCIARDVTLERQKQAQQLQTTANLSAILNASEFSIIATDLDGTIKHFNKGAERLLGYKASEVIGKIAPEQLRDEAEIVKHAEDLSIEIGQEVKPLIMDFVIQSIASAKNIAREWTYYRKDGSSVVMIVSFSAIYNEDGEVSGYLGIGKDISAEKKLELKLTKTRKLLNEVEGIAKTGSWQLKSSTKDVLFSKGFIAIFELENVPPQQLYNEWQKRIDKIDLLKLQKLDEQIFKTGEDYNIIYKIILPNNRIKFISETGRPFKNETGELIGLKGLIQDVTNTIITDQNVKDKTKEIVDIRAALDEAAIVSIMDVQGNYTYVSDNFCAFSKYNREELLGTNHIILASQPTEKLINDIKDTITKGEIWRGELETKAKDGALFWNKMIIVPFKDVEGTIYQYISIIVDMTEQKLMQKSLTLTLEDLMEKNKELDQFSYVVAHDLKAPLRAIDNLAGWIVEDMPQMPAEVKVNFTLLQGRILRMENLINGILDYSRIGKENVPSQKISIKSLLDQIIDNLVPLDRFDIYIDANMPVVFNARILVDQVFSNIISNAVKYNDKEKGKIEFLYQELDDFHEFTVRDNGPGISEKYHEKVFGVFQTIEARDIIESTGIGLSIVKKIIEGKNGEISIDPNYNEGASFVFTLPK